MDWDEIAPGIIIFNDVLEDPNGFTKDLESLVEIGSLSNWKSGLIVGGSKPGVHVDTEYRNVFSIELPQFDFFPEKKKEGSEYVIHKFLNDNLLPYFEKYCELVEAPYWKKKDKWQLLKYGPEQFFIKHHDDCLKNPRTISMSYYPNDDYEGGEIEFDKLKLKIKPKANQALFFPSNYVYLHTVHKVISGYRYAVVNWWDL